MTRVKEGERVRAKTPRSRKGCLTCKIRRVKCDEAYPACLRCTSTGRNCDRNEAAVGSSSALTQPLMQSISTFGDVHESRYLQFFVERTIGQLTAFFPDELWKTHVLQVAQSDEAIRHALVSFSAYHEGYTNDSSNEEVLFALRHYSLSIKKLRESRHHSSTYVHLVSCAIFICIELLRGHLGTATQLFKYGHEIINESRQQANRHNDTNSCLVSDLSDAMELVEAFFARLSIQVSLFVGDVNPELSLRSMPAFRQTRAAPDISIQSLSDARSGLLDITRKHTMGLNDECERAEIADHLTRWTQAFDAFVSMRRKSALRAVEQRSIALMEVHKRYLNLSLLTTLPGDAYNSLNWDHYVDYIDEMLDYAGLTVRNNESEEVTRESSQFHVDIGIIPILWYVVLRCRDPHIRRRAICIMRSSRIQDGFWHSSSVATVAQRIMVSEEGDAEVRSSEDIPCARRVRQALVFLALGERRAAIEYRAQHGGWQETLEW